MRTQDFMELAIAQAKLALAAGDVPVGAVVEKDGRVLSMAHNLREKRGQLLAHAELLAIEEACRVLGTWRMDGCSLYVTLEPCPMCAGAIAQSRMRRVYFGSYDRRLGAMGTVLDVCAYGGGPRPQVYGGIREEECNRLLSEFFQTLRE